MALLHEALKRQTVDESPYTPCPAAGCALAVRPRGAQMVVLCKCGTKFCHACGQPDPHLPVPCFQATQWLQKLVSRVEEAELAAATAANDAQKLLNRLPREGRRGAAQFVRLMQAGRDDE